jgi:succinoglycan biosynthesis protein ExoV
MGETVRQVTGGEIEARTLVGMRLHYFSEVPNFGDDLNRWLWADLFGGGLPADASSCLVGIGSILDDHVPCDRSVLVLGSGVGYGTLPSRAVRAGWNILGVRGPLTARLLELPPSTVITDSALLLRGLSCGQPLSSSERDGGVVFMPHHRSDDIGLWSEICRRAEVQYVSPYGDSRETVNTLRRARLVLADAMHAAIVADTLRVPWVPIVTSCEVSSFKWIDWTLSMELEYDPVQIPLHNLRSQWRDFTLRALKQTRFRTPFDAETQLQRGYTQLCKAPGVIKNIQNALSLRACGKRGMRWVGQFEGNLLFRGREERLIEAAAESLRLSALRSGFLSEEAHLNRKFEELSTAAFSLSGKRG